MPGIALVDRSTEAPHSMTFDVWDDAIRWEGRPANAKVAVEPASVGFDFVRLMKLTIVQGRDFSRENPSDSSDGFLINETAAKEMGLKQPIGKWVSAWNKKGHIIGVLRDYHTRSLRDPIRPLLLDVKEYEYFGMILIRTLPGQTKAALASIATVYREIEPDLAFSWQFVDEEYQKLYNSEMITGASVRQIPGLFSADFLKLILLAFLIAGPLGWLAMRSWLSNFAYRVDLSWWIFAAAGAGIASLAILTIGYQAARAAWAKPVNALRSE
jgi:putative ABC transport system permease protein